MTTALITGASSGIGLELARLMAADQINLVLVARTAPALEALASELRDAHRIEVKLIVADLGAVDAAARVAQQLADTPIDYLINNAGFGDFGPFVDSDWTKTQAMIALNITALTQLTHLLLPAMVERGNGRIMNVASTASFQPGPWMAVYYATKAYVLAFSDALSFELRGTGVSVTTLCPGPTASGFQSAAAMEESKLVKGKKMPSSADVAAYAYRGLKRGKGVMIHGGMNWIMAQSVRFTPRALLLRVVDFMSRRDS